MLSLAWDQDGWRERAVVLTLIVIAVFMLAGVALTYFAVHKIRPKSFRIRATMTKWISVEIEIQGRAQKLDSATGRGAQHEPSD
jgi:hypothetical protein